jgi:uncharacterized membrane protein YeaQ/YmgE (transglycosylase-associated protein family)
MQPRTAANSRISQRHDCRFRKDTYGSREDPARTRATLNESTIEQSSTEGNTMHILWSLIVGLVVGAIAKLLMPGKDPGGIVVTALLGIGGAMFAAFIGRALGLYRAGDVGPGVIASVVGAMLLLGIYRLVTGRRHRIV